MKLFLCLLLLLFGCGPALAHFGAVIPADDIISQSDSGSLSIAIKFVHPMEGHYMQMAKPREFAVRHRGKTSDLLPALQVAAGRGADQEENFRFWQADFQVKRPGDHTFYVVPQPYWEPAEDLFIVHYTKVCVSAFGMEDSWGEPIGLETEIVPLTRPYGLWTNNLFSGQVLLRGKPVPHAQLEVEYLNESIDNPSVVIPSADPYVTQVVRADVNGVFHYAMPRAGWWGFSALSQADWTLPLGGENKAVEIGAVYWVHTRDMR